MADTTGIIAALASFVSAKLQNNATVRSAQICASAQNSAVDRQYESQMQIERFRLIYADQQHAHRLLIGWIHDMDTLVDDIWRAICSSDEEARTRTGDITEGIPWGGSRRPREVAQVEYFWDDRTRELVKNIDHLLEKVAWSACCALPRTNRERDSLIKPDEEMDQKLTIASTYSFMDARDEFKRSKALLVSYLHCSTFDTNTP